MTVGASAALSSNAAKAALENKGDPGRLKRPRGAVPQIGLGAILHTPKRALAVQQGRFGERHKRGRERGR